MDTTSLVIDKELLNHIDTNYNYTEIIKNTGDSNEPDIPDNSLLFIDKNNTYIKSNSIYLINTADGLYIKRIHIKEDKHYMKSINSIYNDIELTEYEVIGRVKGVLIKI